MKPFRSHSIFITIVIGLLHTGCGAVSHHANKLSGPCITSFGEVITEEENQEVIINSPSLGGDALAQSFTVTHTNPLYIVQVKLVRIGSPSKGDLTLSIQTDSGGQPDGVSLASAVLVAQELDRDSNVLTQNISTTPVFYNFTVSTESNPLTLDITKTYWIVLAASHTASDTSTIKWLGNSSNPYATGQALYKTSTILNTWSSGSIGANRDFLFVLGGGCDS